MLTSPMTPTDASAELPDLAEAAGECGADLLDGKPDAGADIDGGDQPLLRL